MDLSVFEILIPLLFLLLVICALPMLVTVIYKHFYTNHVNRILEADATDADATDTADASDAADSANESDGSHAAGKNQVKSASGKAAHRWMTPRSVFLIVLCAEILIYVICGMVSKVTSPDSENEYPDVDLQAAYETYTQSEVEESPFFQYFDGSDVHGYVRHNEKTDGDITYTLYENADGTVLPEYILRLTYTGSENINSWDDSLYANNTSAGTMGEMDDNSNVIYAAFSKEVLAFDDASFTLNLYAETLEDASDGFGTYDMSVPAASITIELQ